MIKTRVQKLYPIDAQNDLKPYPLGLHIPILPIEGSTPWHAICFSYFLSHFSNDNGRFKSLPLRAGLNTRKVEGVQ